jgi:hypothetical protein
MGVHISNARTMALRMDAVEAQRQHYGSVAPLAKNCSSQWMW